MTRFRIDRLLCLAVFAPLARHLPSRSPRIPILMYHSISGEENSATREKHPYYATTTSPSVFRRQMGILKEHGYETISLGEAAGLLKKKRKVVRPAVVITFDDGFRDFYDEAVPVLRHYGFSATMFLPTGYMSDSGETFLGRKMLTWGQVRELQKAGMRFGSHSVTHGKLVRLNRRRLLKELTISRREIEDHTGVETRSFSYPYALPDQHRTFISRLEALLRQAGYRQGVSTRIGVATSRDPVYFFKRIPVNRWDDDLFFISKLRGGYDWVYGIQRTYKNAKGVFEGA